MYALADERAPIISSPPPFPALLFALLTIGMEPVHLILTSVLRDGTSIVNDDTSVVSDAEVITRCNQNSWR